MVRSGKRVNRKVGWSEDGVSSKKIKATQKSRKAIKCLQIFKAAYHYNL
jgi:hypothetical protein